MILGQLMVSMPVNGCGRICFRGRKISLSQVFAALDDFRNWLIRAAWGGSHCRTALRMNCQMIDYPSTDWFGDCSQTRRLARDGRLKSTSSAISHLA
jgi:hypothetical protein